jgi:hypothetical protein
VAKGMLETAISVGLGGGEIAGDYRGRARWRLILEDESFSTGAAIERLQVAGLALGDGRWVPRPRALSLPPTTCIRWRGTQQVELTVSGTGTLHAHGRLQLRLAGAVCVRRGEALQRGSFDYAFEGVRI